MVCGVVLCVSSTPHQRARTASQSFAASSLGEIGRLRTTTEMLRPPPADPRESLCGSACPPWSFRNPATSATESSLPSVSPMPVLREYAAPSVCRATGAGGRPEGGRPAIKGK